MARLHGIITVTRDGVAIQAKGHFDVQLGTPKREAIVGQNGELHGFTETPQPGMITGTITDRRDVSLTDLFGDREATITLEAGEGTYSLSGAVYTGDATFNTEAGEAQVAWSGPQIEEIK